MLAPIGTIVIHDGPSTLEFLGSLAVAGVLAPLAAALATRWSDRRRFKHEREQNATGDLVERSEEVLDLLDSFGGRCADLRQIYIGPMMKAAEEVWSRVLIAEDAYQRVRVAIAKLRMRPHADEELLEAAEKAAARHLDGVRAVRQHVIRHRAEVSAGNSDPIIEPAVEEIMDSVEEGYDLTKEYATLARAAIGRLQDPGD
jgi:hypothetical protein